jgi:hypothetical protein
MNLEEKFLNSAAAALPTGDLDEGSPNFRGPVPPAAKLEAPVGEYVLTPDSPEAAARIAAGRSTPASIVGQEAPTAKPASAPSLPAVPVTDRVFPEYSGSIQSIPRNTLQEMMGNIGSAIQSGAEYLDFAVIGLPDVGTLTLKDLTVGDLGKVMEAMSYGFYPVETKSAAGIPLLMPTAEALDLLNAIPAFQAANKAIQYGAKGLRAGAEALAPAAANMMEEGLRKSGMIMDIVPDGKSVAQQAAKSDIGFYSAVENAAVNVQRKSGAGQSFLNDIMKGENVKAEEIKWMGLDDFLKGKKNVTKQEVQDYIANNKVDVQEVKSTVIRPLLDNGARPVFEGDKGAFLPKFGQYVLEGGENYRELLLTMPDKRPAVFTVQADSLTKEFNTMDEATAYKNTLMQQYPNSSPNIIQNKSLAPDNVNYKSSHFPDQRNILAHLRVNDRVDADGKKMLLIEEVQSDWHQAGRDKGYKTKQNLENWYNQNKLENDPPFADLNSEQIKTIEQNRNAGMGNDDGVPDAPFKDTWYQLALKRALQHAAENGYERVGLTTGSQQAARFDLSKQVNAVSYHPDDNGRGMFLNVFGKNNEVIYSKLTPENEVANVIGKETAKKLLEQKPIDNNRVLQGLDLKIGGEGMKKYYDEIYPKFLEKYGKKWNAKMGETKIRTQSDKQAQEDLDLLEGLGEDRSKFSGSGMARVRYIDITPEMKAGVKKGQPLFAAAPIGAATGAATMQDEGKK